MEKGVVLYTPNTVSEETVLGLKDVNAKVLRLEISDVAQAGTVAYLSSHGFKVVGLLPVSIVPGATSRQWQAPVDSLAFKKFVRDYAQQAALLSASMPTVYAWEVCNEPASLSSSFRIDPEPYAHLFSATYASISKPALVGTGGVFQHTISKWGGASKNNAAYSWLLVVTWELELLYCTADITFIHPYLSNLAALPQYLEYTHEATGCPIVISESGRQVNAVGLAGQADYLKNLFRLAQEDGRVTSCCWFSWEDIVIDGKVENWGLSPIGGLIHRPSFYALQGV